MPTKVMAFTDAQAVEVISRIAQVSRHEFSVHFSFPNDSQCAGFGTVLAGNAIRAARDARQ